jgi:hypothetical protein
MIKYCSDPDRQLCVMCQAISCLCCTDQYPVFAGSDMSINLLSANHRNAWNVLMPGFVVIGGEAWRGVGQGALEV